MKSKPQTPSKKSFTIDVETTDWEYRHNKKIMFDKRVEKYPCQPGSKNQRTTFDIWIASHEGSVVKVDICERPDREKSVHITLGDIYCSEPNNLKLVAKAFEVAADLVQENR